MPAVVDKTKVSMNLTPGDIEIIKELAKTQGISMTETVRRAIATEKFIRDTIAQGSKILIEDQEHNVREVVLR